MNPQSPPTAAAPAGTLGTFAGVFTPSILTILGLILFMRMGYVVGAAGLGDALLILTLANGISVLTSLSLSAVATNLRVKRGGDYYLISRTLGHEFGGAIGLVMFLAQAISIGFYCIGFAEVFATLLPAPFAAHTHLIAAVATALLFVLAWLGADWATRFQYVVMAVLAAALLSFFLGAAQLWDSTRVAQNWNAPAGGLGFWVLFALFFPAVTGFTQGVSMSGDLKEPGRSLPLGTLSAVGLSIVIYFAAALAFAGALPQDELLHDYAAMDRAALFPSLIAAGVIAATLSSAMASFMGAPRILQSLAGDRLFRWLTPFAHGVGPTHNPRRGVLLAGGIALATVSLGQLNLIAPLVSMFFLISYGLINYATFYEARAASPWFRPRFRFFHRHLSLLGALACLGAMLAIDLAAGLISAALLFAIYEYLRRTAPASRWADGRRAYHTQRIREHLLAAAREPRHPRDWRPNVLLFSDDRERRAQLLRLAAWFSADSGFATAVTVLEGRGPALLKRRAEAEAALAEDIHAADVAVFPLAIAAPDLNSGLHVLVQGFGIGHLKANIVLLNWLEMDRPDADGQRELRYGSHLRTAFRLGCNLVVLDAEAADRAALDRTEADARRIDIWWRNDATSRLMLLLAYLMTRTVAWHGAHIRLLGICNREDSAATAAELHATLDEIRIEAEPIVVEQADAETLIQHSRHAALVFLPLRLRGNQPLGPFDRPLDELLAPLPTAVMVLAAEDMDLDAEPEEGAAAERARLLDAAADGARLAELAERDTAEAEAEVQRLRELAAAVATVPADDALDTAGESADQLKDAEARAEKAHRRAARTLAKAKAARAEAVARGLLPDDTDPPTD